jgi:hypothetical protein
MKRISRWASAGVFILALTVLISVALAQRHGGGRRVGGLGISGLCGSAATISTGLTTIELMIKPTPEQQAALNELKTVAKLNADEMTAVCLGSFPKSLPERVAGSEKRLDVALAGIRALKPPVEKFYATLNDQQKTDVSIMLILPGL